MTQTPLQTSPEAYISCNNNEDEISIIKNHLGKRDRYDQRLSNKTWSAAFLRYIAILLRFEKYMQLNPPAHQFHGRIVNRKKSSPWLGVADGCLRGSLKSSNTNQLCSEYYIWLLTAISGSTNMAIASAAAGEAVFTTTYVSCVSSFPSPFNCHPMAGAALPNHPSQ